jgi:hypothetical protein
MGILALIGSGMLFTLFAAVVLFILINMSSRFALVVLFLTPLFFIFLMPGTSIAFLSYRHMLLANGLVPINNFHILLMLWSTLIGIILYTDFLTWYLARGTKMKKGKMDNGQSREASVNVLQNTSSAIGKAKEVLLKRN